MQSWNPYTEGGLSKRIKAISDALNIGTYLEVLPVKGQDLSKSPFIVTTSPRHCFTKTSTQKYFGVVEHPLTEKFLYHFTSKKHRPLWIYIVGVDGDLKNVVRSVCEKRLRKILVKVLNANGYGHWGDRMPGFDDKSVLHGTIHIRIQQGKEFVKMSDQEVYDTLDRLMKKSIIYQLRVREWPIQQTSVRRVQGGQQSSQQRGSSSQPQRRDQDSRVLAGGSRDTRQTSANTRPRVEDGTNQSNVNQSRAQQLAGRFRDRSQNPGPSQDPDDWW